METNSKHPQIARLQRKIAKARLMKQTPTILEGIALNQRRLSAFIGALAYLTAPAVPNFDRVEIHGLWQ